MISVLENTAITAVLLEGIDAEVVAYHLKHWLVDEYVMLSDLLEKFCTLSLPSRTSPSIVLIIVRPGRSSLTAFASLRGIRLGTAAAVHGRRTIIPHCASSAPIIDVFQCSHCEWSFAMAECSTFLNRVRRC